jgi:Flp pilus assembly protein TadB
LGLWKEAGPLSEVLTLFLRAVSPRRPMEENARALQAELKVSAL